MNYKPVLPDPPWFTLTVTAQYQRDELQTCPPRSSLVHAHSHSTVSKRWTTNLSPPDPPWFTLTVTAQCQRDELQTCPPRSSLVHTHSHSTVSKRWTTNLSPPDPPWFTLTVTAQCQRDELQTCPPRSSLVHAHSHSTVSKWWTTNLSSPILPGSRSQSQHSVKEMNYKPVPPDPPWFTLTVTAQCQKCELQTCSPRAFLVHAHNHGTVLKSFYIYKPVLPDPPWFSLTVTAQCQRDELQTCPPWSSLVHAHSHGTVLKRWTTNLFPSTFLGSRSQSRYSNKEMNYKPVPPDPSWFTLTVTVQCQRDELQTCSPRPSLVHPHNHGTVKKRWTTNLFPPILPGSPSQSRYSKKEMNYKPVPPDPPWFTLTVTVQCQRDELQTCSSRPSLVHPHSHGTVLKSFYIYKPVPPPPDPPWFTLALTAQC